MENNYVDRKISTLKNNLSDLLHYQYLYKNYPFLRLFDVIILYRNLLKIYVKVSN